MSNLPKESRFPRKKFDMKKIISLVLVAVSLLLLPSCSSDCSYDEAEVKAAAEDLIRDAAVYNDIFWGGGIPYDKGGYSNGIYYAADVTYLHKMGFLKLEDIYKKAANIYSADYLDSIYLGMNTNGKVRYYEESKYIMVNSNYEPFLVDEIRYLYDTLEVLGSDGDTVSVKISVKVTRGEATQTRDKEIDLVKEGERWLIDSPTYTTFRPEGLKK